MLYQKLNVIILAAGQGKRMLSDIPKVMYKIAGKFMIQHLVDSVVQIDVQCVYIVYSHDSIILTETICSNNPLVPIYWILQESPNGTGDAVQKALSVISDDELEVLILYGDVPLVSTNTLQKLYSKKSQCDISLLTAEIIDPSGYGRIIRNQNNQVISIIEDNNIIHDNYKKINEINSGIFISIVGYLKNWLKILRLQNSTEELYLTDIVNIAYCKEYVINTINPISIFEVIGINNKLDLVRLERIYQKKQAQNLLELGVIISDPNRFDLRGTLICGKDVYIDINVIIEGYVSLGNRVQIGANCILKNVIIEDDVIIYPFSIIEHSQIKCQSKIGPFSRLRPGNQLAEKTRVGNFVELKNIQLGKQSKVDHLTYLGDAEIGSQVNIGAGTVICNYDGITKHRTSIKDFVFIGANSQLIAPIIIEKNSTIGAGTTVTQNVSEGETIISRIRQFSILSRNRSKKN